MLYFSLALFIIIGILVFILIDRNDKYKDMQNSYEKLLRTFDELDEQAKLIVKTDLELNKAQEDLDKRLTGLDALQKTSRLISNTLDENEIFHRLSQPLLTELGFEKYFVLMFDKEKQLQCFLDFGFPREETHKISAEIGTQEVMLNLLKEGNLISSAKTPKDVSDHIRTLFQVKHFVMTPILAQSEMLGIIFAGNRGDAFPVTEGDEELISILADQMGQAAGNARLFEQVYRSSQALELKVQDRTKQLSSALEEVKKISKTKSEFISAVSHELRTPLTSIKGYASLLIAGKIGEIPDKVKERLEKINKHSDNLVKLINDLLDIARIESGRTEMNFAQENISPIIDNAQDLLMPQMKEKNVHFKTDLPAEIPPVFIDAGQIERVFINLVGNAIKFTPPGGTITVKVVCDPKKLILSVTDTGIGIKEEATANLFNEFYRIDNEINQNVKGTGLGLALVKKIVEAHGGKIWVTSVVHQGSTFSFTIPLDYKKKTS